MKKTLPYHHLGGIIPLVGHQKTFGLPWQDFLMPVGENLLAVERAIAECVTVGCNSIWIACDHQTLPLLRYRLGDFALHAPPQKSWANGNVIPIYYVLCVPDRFEKEVSLGKSIIKCADTSRQVQLVSWWLCPQMFYVAWPMTVIEPRDLGSKMNWFKKREVVLIRHNGETVLDGRQLPFLFRIRDRYRALRRLGSYDGHDLKEMFNFKEKDKSYFDIKECRDISNWKNYMDCLSKGPVGSNHVIFLGKEIQ